MQMMSVLKYSPWFFTRLYGTSRFSSYRIWRSEASRVSSYWNNLDAIDHLKEEKPFFFFNNLEDFGASLVAQTVKNMPVVQETCVWSLGWEDPPEEGMASHCHILAWRIPWTEEPSRLQSMGSQRVRHNWVNKLIIDFQSVSGSTKD